jgi:uncharacterized protein YgiM (DUF1202 family)
MKSFNIIKRNVLKRTISFLLSILLIALVIPFFTSGIIASASNSNLTSIGLAEFALKAYNDGWQYDYGKYGQLNSSGVRVSDCSGLIYAYLCWSGDTTDPIPNYSMPRTVTAQAQSSSESGPISTIPRTHGLLITIANYDHVGVYLGNDMEADCSDYGVNMRYASVSSNSSWIMWHKLDCIEYPTNGWYKFNGNEYYYVDGQYVINTTMTIDGVSYTFGSDGIPSTTPSNTSGSTTSDDLNISAYTTDLVNFRSGMSTSSSVIKVLPSGTEVTIINKSSDTWYKVKLSDGTIGYINSTYLSTNSSSASSSDTESSVTYYTTDYVNERTEASTSSSIITVLPTGTAVNVVDTSNSSWYKVKLSNGSYGYIYSEYLSVSSPSSSDSNTNETNTINESYTATDAVNVRSGPSTSYTVLKTIASGTPVTVTDKSNASWYKVQVDSITGYINSKYLTTGTTSSSSSVTGTSYYTNECVNLRASSSLSGSIVKVLASGTKVTVTDTSNSEWYAVSLNSSVSGFIYSIYLTPESSSSNSSSDTSTITETYIVTDYVNVRSGAGTSSSIITTLSEGTSVEVVDTANSSWYKVHLSDGTYGYMYSQYLKKSSDSSVGTYITTDYVNFRTGAGMSNSVIKILPTGTSVNVSDTSNNYWYKATLSDGTEGYISSLYIKKS